MFPPFQASEPVTDDDMSGFSDNDTPLQSNTNLAAMDADASSPSTSAAAAASAPDDAPGKTFLSHFQCHRSMNLLTKSLLYCLYLAPALGYKIQVSSGRCVW